MKDHAVFLLKLIVLTLATAVLFLVASRAAGFTDELQAADAGRLLGSLLAVSALYAVVLSYPIVRSRWSGWPLVLTVFLVFFGVTTFLTQIETVLFLQYLVDVVPAEAIPRLFLQGFILAALLAPLAVLVHGRMRRRKYEPQPPNRRLVMPWREWAWKLALVAGIYVVIYLSFGLFVFIPLAGAAFQEFYADLQLPGWVLLFQAARGLVWALLALPVIRMMRGEWWEAGMAVALLFSVLMGAQLLFPNEFMPDAIRHAHLVEVVSSNFVFGWIVVWLFHRRHGSFGGLFRRG